MIKVEWNANKDMVPRDERVNLAQRLASGEYKAPGLFRSVTLNSDNTVTFTATGNLVGMWSPLTKADSERAVKANAARAKADAAVAAAAEAASKAQAEYTKTMAEMDLQG